MQLPVEVAAPHLTGNKIVTETIRNLVFESFNIDAPLPELTHVEEAGFSSSEEHELWRELRSKRWPDIADPDVFEAATSDVLAWGAYLPICWYLYFLPAFLIVADEGKSIYFENFRGILCTHLELTPATIISSRDQLLFDALHVGLDTSKWDVIRQFLNKYPA